MRTFVLGICIFIASSAMAQRNCAGSIYLEQQTAIDPSLPIKINAVENFIKQQSFAKMQGEDFNVIRIPVVIHLLYNTAAQNISDEQIKSQLVVLNNDFRRRNADSSKTPERFSHLAADVQIEFVLATADPNGRATSGIIRKHTNVALWKTDDKIKFSAQGGDDAWDSRQYLNIWIGNLGHILGYSSVPGGAAEKDGIAINMSAFGTINVNAPYHLGRTAVHEMGHWLGLRHIWGDTYCGDDMVDDTPKQGNFTSGCPTAFRSSCNNGTTTGDMYMNYMDYTADACVNLFTEGQKQRMLALFNTGGPRHALLSSNGLKTPWNLTVPEPVVEAPLVNASFRIYPNPSSSDIVMNFEFDDSWIGQNLSLVNLNGIVISTIRVNSRTQKLDISSLKPGMYFIQGFNGNKKIREKLVKM
jgi:hypothetical protein